MANGLFGTNNTTPQIRQVAIQPTGVPGSTYVRPQQQESGKNLAALADALGSLNGALSAYGTVAERERQDPNSEANRAFADSIAGMSLEDAMKKFPEAKGRIQKDGVLSLVGSNAAYEFRQHITDEYNNGGFDQSQGDFNSWVEEKRKEYAGGLGDPAMQAAFYRGTDNFLQQFGEADLKRKIETAQVERDTAVVDEFRMIVDDGLTANKTPEDIAAEVIKQSGQNRTFRGLDGRSQNDTLLRLAEEYSLKGRPELVKALLHDKRGGVGPLIEVSGMTDKGLKLIEQAEGIRQRDANSTSFDLRTKLDDDVANGRVTKEQIEGLKGKPGNEWLTDAMASDYLERSSVRKQTLLAAEAKEENKRRLQYQSVGQRTQVNASAFANLNRLGGSYRLQDVEIVGPNGDPVTVTAKEQEKEGVKRFLSGLKEEEEGLLAKGAHPQQTREQILKKRIAWFDGNGVVDEELQGKFNGAVTMSSIDRVLQGGEQAEFLAGIAEEYRQLDDLNPAYAERLVASDKSREFLEQYAAGRNDLMGPNDALIHAAQMANRTVTQRAQAKLAYEDMRDAVDDVFSELDVDEGPNGDNRAWVQDQLAANLNRQMDLNTAKARVIQKAQERTFEVGGVLMMEQPGMSKDAPELFERALEDAFKEYGKTEGIPDVSDLYLDQVANGQWIVMSRTKGNAPLNWGLKIDFDTLTRKRQERDAEKQALSEAARAADADERKVARDALWSSLESDRQTVERWEKRAGRKTGVNIAAGIARRLRENYENDLREFNTPPKLPSVLAKERNDQLKEEAAKNADELGFKSSLR